jgi:nitrate/nitrite transporter NarK
MIALYVILYMVLGVLYRAALTTVSDRLLSPAVTLVSYMLFTIIWPLVFIVRLMRKLA